MNRILTVFTVGICLFTSNIDSVAETKFWSPKRVAPYAKTADIYSWNNPENWQPKGIPTKDDDVVVNNYIFLHSDAECKSLTLNKFTLHLQGHSLVVRNNATITNYALVDPQGSGTLAVKGKMYLDGTLWVSRNKSFDDNYNITYSALIVDKFGSVIATDNKEYAGIPGRAALKEWDKVKSNNSKILASKTWDAGAGDGLWSSINNWDNVSAPTNGDNVIIGTVGTPDATITCDVSVNGTGLTGGDNVIAGVANSDIILSINDGITVRFRSAGGINAFGTDANGNSVSSNTVRFTQSGPSYTGKFRFVSTSSEYYFEDATFDVYGSQFSDNYEFGTSGSVFTFIGTNIDVRYLRSGAQTITTVIPTPNGETYKTLTIGGTGTKSLAGTVNATSLTLNNTAFTIDPVISTNKLNITGGSSPTTQSNNTYLVRGAAFTDNYGGFGTSISGTTQFNSSSSQTVPSGYTFSTLQLYGSGAKSLGGNVSATTTLGDGVTGTSLDLGTATLTGNITVAANSNLTFSSTGSVSGTITSNTNSTVTYSSGSQNISAGTYYNLNLSGSGTKTFPTSNVTVNGIFTVGSGVTAVTQGSNKVDLGTTGSLTETGTFTGNISATDADGDGSYGNIGIAVASSSGALGSNVEIIRSTGASNVEQFSSLGGNAIRKYRIAGGTLSSSTISNSNPGTITLSYQTTELNGQNQTTLRAYRTNSGGATYPNTTQSSDGKNGEPMDASTSKSFPLYRFFSASAPSDAGSFYFANGFGTDAALPVELASFKGSSEKNGISLLWETASETNNAGFILSRRNKNSSYFQEISSYLSNDALKGAGNSANGRKYFLIDDRFLIAGQSYEYQLEDVSFDGKRTVIGNITILYSTTEEILLRSYPSPVTNKLNIEIDSPEKGLADVKVFDVNGKIVLSKEELALSKGSNHVFIDVNNLPAGKYFYSVNISGEKITRLDNSFVIMQ